MVYRKLGSVQVEKLDELKWEEGKEREGKIEILCKGWKKGK